MSKDKKHCIPYYPTYVHLTSRSSSAPISPPSRKLISFATPLQHHRQALSHLLYFQVSIRRFLDLQHPADLLESLLSQDDDQASVSSADACCRSSLSDRWAILSLLQFAYLPYNHVLRHGHHLHDVQVSPSLAESELEHLH